MGSPGPLHATLSKLLTYRVLRPIQPPTVSGTGTEFIYCEVWDEGRVSMIGDNGVFGSSSCVVHVGPSAGNGHPHNALRYTTAPRQ